MFGHQDDQHDDNQGDEPQHQQDTATATAPEIAPDQPSDNTTDDTSDAGSDSQAQDDQHASAYHNDTDSGDDSAWQHPGTPTDDSTGQIKDIITPAGHKPNLHPSAPAEPQDNSPVADDDDDANVPHELIDIKQKALGQLTPLMDQLDQTPEEKFRTIMMMVQANDDQSLIKQAYEAANAIEDEKVKGQALLDIVNEINYFTQHPIQESEN